MKINSALHFVGIADVVKDYDYLNDQGVLECYLKEFLPEHEGDHMTPNMMVKSASSPISGQVMSTASKKRTIKAKWLPLGARNRVTPPHLCVGDQVLIYQIGKTGMYYWEDIFNSPDLRKHERVTWLFSNRPLNIPPGLNQTMKSHDMLAYKLTLDTYDKQVHFSAPHNDGELTPWDIQLDTKEGILTIITGFTDEIQLDSKAHDLNISTRHNIDILNDNDILIGNGNDVKLWNAQKIIIKNGVFYSPIKITPGEEETGYSLRKTTEDVRTKDLKGPNVLPQMQGMIDIENGIDINILNHHDINTKNMNDITTLNMHDITVTNMNDITVTNTNNITVTNGNDTTVTNANNITVTNANNIALTNTNNIDINNMNSISLTNMNSIDIKNMNSITLMNMVNIDITNMAMFNINNTGPMSVTAGGPLSLTSAVQIGLTAPVLGLAVGAVSGSLGGSGMSLDSPGSMDMSFSQGADISGGPMNLNSTGPIEQSSMGWNPVSNGVPLFPTLVELCNAIIGATSGVYPPAPSVFGAIAAKFQTMQGA